MKIIKCRDLGFKCDFMAAGSNQDEVKKTILDHIEKEHKGQLPLPARLCGRGRGLKKSPC
jgi:Protein of unknown function (DUF1059)